MNEESWKQNLVAIVTMGIVACVVHIWWVSLFALVFMYFPAKKDDEDVK